MGNFVAIANDEGVVEVLFRVLYSALSTAYVLM